MKTNPSPNDHWPRAGTGIWMRWWGYLVRWLVFGLVVHLFQPVADGQAYFWLQKADQALIGLTFGLVGAVVFTVAENTLNTPRVRWKSWVIVVGTWLVVQVIFASVGSALD
jgi:hypothetical protein